MIGAIVIAVIVVVALPAVWWVTWGLMAAVLGWLLKRNAEATHAGSDLIDTNY